MRRQEFIKELQARLEGELSPAQVQEHIRYYDEYIREGVSAGKTEDEMTASLGSPLLIAKSILETAREAKENAGTSGYSQYGNGQNSYNGQGTYGNQGGFGSQGGFGGHGGFGGNGGNGGFGSGNWGGWNSQDAGQGGGSGSGIGKWLVIAVIVVIVVALFSILGSIMAFALRFFFPIIVIVLIVSLVRRGGRR